MRMDGLASRLSRSAFFFFDVRGELLEASHHKATHKGQGDSEEVTFPERPESGPNPVRPGWDRASSHWDQPLLFDPNQAFRQTGPGQHR